MTLPARYLPADRPGRTEYDVTCDTLARLILARLLADLTPVGITRAARTAGVRLDDVKRAVVAIRDGRTPLPGEILTLAPDPRRAAAEEQPVPKGRGGKAPSAVVRRDPTTGTVSRRCCRCKAWKPLDAFLVKNPATGARVSMCHPCRSDYHHERYLNLDARRALGAVGISFTYRDGDPLVLCARCRNPLADGDRVTTTAVVEHVTCPGSAPCTASG